MKKNIARNESGQTTVEYIVILGAIALMGLALINGLVGNQFQARLLAPLNSTFKYAYQYGHPGALGFDDKDGPKKHPRVVGGEGNFRIFINPSN